MSAAQGGTLQVRLTQMDDLRNAIYARMVRKVGSRTYWDQWARDIAVIAQAHITRITALVDDPAPPPRSSSTCSSTRCDGT